MSLEISPKYLMSLVNQIEQKIWKEFESYKNVEFYIKKWHEFDEDWNNPWENFKLIYKEEQKIDLQSTLHNIDGETLLKIAIDLEIDTPDFIPSISEFKNELKSDYNTAHKIFEKALKEIETNPDMAIGLANSALESIIKEILKSKEIASQINQSKTLYDLTNETLKQFHLFPTESIPIEIRTIGSSLLGVNKGIEQLRSKKTNVHGKTDEESIIEEEIFAYFIVNSVTTVGKFLISYYKNFYKEPEVEEKISIDDLPF